MTDPFVSYAQNFEDVILWRALRQVVNGFYVDVGAQDPTVESVSRGFYERGWRGVHVDASPQWARALRNARPDEIVIEAAVGTRAGTIPFYEVPATGLGTGDPEIARQHETEAHAVHRINVPCLPLDEILEPHADRDIHWLKIDVEGMEVEVLESWRSGVRPWIVVVEATAVNSCESTHEEWEPDLLRRGYRFVYFDGLNRFYLSEAHADLADRFGPGPNVFDDFVLNADATGPFARLVNDRLAREAERAEAFRVELEQTKAANRDEIDRMRETHRETLRERDLMYGGLHAEYERVAALNSALLASTSWRATAPLRAATYKMRHLRTGTHAWLHFVPGSRPHRIAHLAVHHVANLLERNPRVARQARRLLEKAPGAKRALLRLMQQSGPDIVSEPPTILEHDTAAVRLAYRRLTAAGSADGMPPVASDRGKPRLAFVSPLPPDRSGVAEYSAMLLPALAEHYDITGVVQGDPERVGALPGLEAVIDEGKFQRTAYAFDRVLYNIGNSPLHSNMFELVQDVPGIVVFHDIYLGNVLAHLEQAGWLHYWTRALYAEGGYSALRQRFSADVEATIRDHPASFSIARAAQGVVTLNRWAMTTLEATWAPSRPIPSTILRLPRPLPAEADRAAAKRRLGLAPSDFLVCTFGHLGPTKLSPRLLNIWQGSALADDSSCHLIFVGGCGDEMYLDRLSRQAASGKGRIRITGFLKAAEYENHLAAADLAVQLRHASRGESSGTALDAMAHGLPVIVNANGSMAELPDEGLIKLADTFTDAELVTAIEELRIDPDRRAELGAQARKAVAKEHSPENVAALYTQAIETFFSDLSGPHDPAAIAAGAARIGDGSEKARLAVAREIAGAVELPHSARQLLVDVSVIAMDDYKTGIQRVVRSQLYELLLRPPPGFRVEPVLLAEGPNGLYLRYARSLACRMLGLPEDLLHGEPVAAAAGDVYFGADYYSSGMVKAEHDGVYDRLREARARIFFTVYDNLPVDRPDLFPSSEHDSHSQWLRMLSRTADGVICISEHVARTTRRYLADHAGEGARQILIHTVHLGADIQASVPTRGLPEDAENVLAALEARPTFLMVGTIEPRKGYLQAIKAFDELWEKGAEVNLVIVGREGWRHVPPEERRTIAEIISRLENNPARGRNLFWLSRVSDEYLERIYDSAVCLISASEDEGFGLPIIEAARHDLPVLARDIPVFREIAGDHVAYFSGSSAGDLAERVHEWLALYEEGAHPRSVGLPWLTWQESVSRLKLVLLGG